MEIRQAPGETAEQVRDRIRGAIRAAGALEVRYVSADGSSIDLSEPGRSTPVGAFDVGVVADGDGVRLAQGYAPRSKVYEALPSVVLGLNRLPEFRDRMAAPRTADGAGWARVETFRGKWKADESTTPGLEYDHRRHGLKAGMDAAVGGHGLLGVSLHHRRGTAEVSAGGDVEPVGPRRGDVRHRLARGRRLRGRAGRGDVVRGRPERHGSRGAEDGRAGPRPCVGGGGGPAGRPGAPAGGGGAHATGRAGAFEGVDGRFHRRGGRARVGGGRAQPEGPGGHGGGDGAGRGFGEPGVRHGGRGARVLAGYEGGGVGGRS